MRAPLFVVAAVLGLSAPYADASASATLTPDRTVARLGDVVTVRGDFCPTGRTVTALTRTTRTSFPKAPVMTLPIDPATAGLVQDASGFRFSFRITEEETWLWFTATCADGTSATSESTPVEVFGPVGQFWFHTPYGRLNATPGAPTTVSVTTPDCRDGSTATATVRRGRTTVVEATTTVRRHALEFTLTIPAGTPTGSAELTVRCTGTDGSEVRDVEEFTVLPGEGSGEFPRSGASLGLALLAAGLLLTGTALVQVAQPREAEAAVRRRRPGRR